MNNTEVMPHCQGCEHSRNGGLWVKRNSKEPLLQARCTWKPWPPPAWEFTLEAAAHDTSIAPRVSIPTTPAPSTQVGAAQEQLHTHSTT